MKKCIRIAGYLVAVMLLQACAGRIAPGYHVTHPPSSGGAGGRRLYPVARQGELTAWLASNHVFPNTRWIYDPDDPETRYPVVGAIRASDMPRGSKHDGAFVITSGYRGPLFPLWEGEECEALMFTGHGRWLAVRVSQLDEAVNSWVRVADGRRIGWWSGHPVVIGDPRHPDAIVGAMWYKSNVTPELGGAASTRMLKKELARLRFEDFVKP